MNCKYFCWRTKRGARYKFCRLHKNIIDSCYCCKDKEYKTYKKKPKHKSKRVKATEIQDGVKEIVWNRDGRKCIFCNTPVSMFYANAHFIPRSQGGLGIVENIFTACDYCHAEQDNGLNTEYYEKRAEEHLKSKHENWNKSDLIYKKYNF